MIKRVRYDGHRISYVIEVNKLSRINNSSVIRQVLYDNVANFLQKKTLDVADAGRQFCQFVGSRIEPFL